MKRALLPPLALWLLLAGGCSALPTAREMGDMALLRTMGVDREGGEMAVTASTGPRARGLQGEGLPALVLSTRGDTLSGACMAMQGLSDSYVFFGYVDQLLVGEEAARAGLRPVLNYFAQDVELGLGAQLWLVRGGTAQAAVSSGGDQGVEGRLSTLRTDGELGVASVARTAGEVYTDLMERGAAFAPALTLAEGQTALLECGYGVLRGDGLAGFLEGEAAGGLELLAGRACSHMVELDRPGGPVSLRITGSHTTSRLEFQGNDPSRLQLTCRVESQLEEAPAELSDRELEEVRRDLERRCRSWLEGALEQLQDWGADCAGLGLRAAASHPGRWSAIEQDWPRWFGRVEIEVEVQVDVHA